jgi:hypothetical protein
MATMKIKDSETYRVDSEEEAMQLIKDMKTNFTVTKASYTMKTKKSKGEIVDMWFQVSIERSYEV